MRLTFQRALDRMAGSLICFLLSLFARKRDAARPDPLPERILVILLSEMGSLVLAAPMFGELRRRYPTASVHALVFERNREVLDLLGEVPASNVLTVNERHFLGFALQSARAVWRMRRARIDTVLDCELFSRISSIYAFLSGARRRVGFHPFTQEGLYRGRMINRPVLYNPHRHIANQFVGLVKALESRELPPAKRSTAEDEIAVPRMTPSDAELEGLRRRVEGDFPSLLERPLVLLYVGGGLLPIRAWPLPSFRTVARTLLDDGHAVGIIGTAEDRPLAERIVNHCRSPVCVDLTGYTRTVRELMVLFHMASLLITNDGGPGHFASMTPLPAILLFGPETPVLYGSLAGHAVNLCAHLSCSPCLSAYNHRSSPCNGHNVCLATISPKEVLETAYGILGPGTEQPA